MKALTIWQPYASLIIEGAKPYEFRTWPAPRAFVGQRIVIHAAARPVRMQEMVDWYEAACGSCGLTLGGGRSELARALDLYDAWSRGGYSADHFPLSVGLGTAILGKPVKCIDLFAGRMNPDDINEEMWAWPLTAIERWAEPIPARGYQGFWNWDKGRLAA